MTLLDVNCIVLTEVFRLKYKFEDVYKQIGDEDSCKRYNIDLELLKKYLDEIAVYCFPEFDGLRYVDRIGSILDCDYSYAPAGNNDIVLINDNNKIIRIKYDENGYEINPTYLKGQEYIYVKYKNKVEDTKNQIDSKDIIVMFYYENNIVRISGNTSSQRGSEYNDYVLAIYSHIPNDTLSFSYVLSHLEPEFVYKYEKSANTYEWKEVKGNGQTIIDGAFVLDSPFTLRLEGIYCIKKLLNLINSFKRQSK